jgi:hypothetical protein
VRRRPETPAVSRRPKADFPALGPAAQAGDGKEINDLFFGKEQLCDLFFVGESG